jgi:hypothetical protein
VLIQIYYLTDFLFLLNLISIFFLKLLKLCKKVYVFCGTLMCCFIYTVEMCISWIVAGLRVFRSPMCVCGSPHTHW